MEISNVLRAVAESLVFSAIGLLAFIICFYLIERVTPFSLRKEVEEDQNVAVGIVLASMVIGIAIIIAAAISG